MNFPLNAFHGHGLDAALLVSLIIGMGFGFALERGGFGSSKVLAGIFYGRDWRVLKVMFTAIVVAMLGLYFAEGMGLVVMDQIAFRSTYLKSQVVGGLMLGVGFVVAGYCPGTSIVGMVSGKLDAIFALVGVVLGIGVFEETFGLVKGFYNASYMGELSIAAWSGVPQGIVVLGVVLMALGAFWATERFGPGGRLKPDPDPEAAPKKLASIPLVKPAVLTLGLGLLVMGTQLVGPGQERAILAGGPKELHYTPQVQAIDVAGWIVEARPDVSVLDVRRDSNSNPIPGAIPVSVESLLDYRQRPALGSSGVYVVVDETGGELGREVVRSLRSTGLDVVLMRGGAKAWQEQVLVDSAQAPNSDERAQALRLMISGESIFGGTPPPALPKKGIAPPKRKKKKGGGC